MKTDPSLIHVIVEDKNKQLRNGDPVEKQAKSYLKCWMEKAESTVKA